MTLLNFDNHLKISAFKKCLLYNYYPRFSEIWTNSAHFNQCLPNFKSFFEIWQAFQEC